MGEMASSTLRAEKRGNRNATRTGRNGRLAPVFDMLISGNPGTFIVRPAGRRRNRELLGSRQWPAVSYQ